MDIETELNYDKLMVLINKSRNIFNKFTRWHLYSFVSNYCLDEISKGNEKYDYEYFKNTEIEIEDKLFMATGDRMSVNYFGNIVRCAIRLKKTDWLRNFLNDYSGYLHTDHKESMVEYTKAMLAFAEGDYESALSISSKVEYVRRSFKQELRTLKLKCYYELGHFESLFAESDSFSRFLTKMEFQQQSELKAYLNFISFLKKIIKAEDTADRHESALLKKQIQEEEELVERVWLTNKINSVAALHKNKT